MHFNICRHNHLSPSAARAWYENLCAGTRLLGADSPRGRLERQPHRRAGAAPMRTLLVASEGGHLVELYVLCERMGITGERVWVPFDAPPSRSLLACQELYFAPSAGTRDLAGTARAVPAR